MSGDAAFDNHDMANEAVASLALIAKLRNGGVALGLAAWAMQLTGPEIAWVWPFSVSSACEVPPAGVVCTVDVVDAELRMGLRGRLGTLTGACDQRCCPNDHCD